LPKIEAAHASPKKILEPDPTPSKIQFNDNGIFLWKSKKRLK